MEKSKSYKENGNIYNLENIWEWMELDYWDDVDEKFDFWGRLMRHQQIFNKVMELNGKYKSNYEGKDCTKELLEELRKKNEKYQPIIIVWDDSDDEWE